MDMFNTFFQLTIIKSLKIDQTVIVQFIIFIIFFNIIAPVLFNKLREILDLREAKTTKLDSSANHIFKQADDLNEQYNGRIEKTHQDAQIASTKKKNEVLAAEKTILTTAEEKISAEYEDKKSKLVKEISEKRNTVMAEAEKLSASLLDKLTK